MEDAFLSILPVPDRRVPTHVPLRVDVCGRPPYSESAHKREPAQANPAQLPAGIKPDLAGII